MISFLLTYSVQKFGTANPHWAIYCVGVTSPFSPLSNGGGSQLLKRCERTRHTEAEKAGGNKS